MGENSAIEWTDHTFNPWRGCDKVSPGCDNCYMFRDQRRYGRDPEQVVRCQDWSKPLKWDQEAKGLGVRRLVFTCSWSDFFHAKADPWRREAWELIRRTPNLIYQILTKRPALVPKRLPGDWGDGYPNVWLGVSAEDQRTANERIPALLYTPATVRFISAEPLLGPINLTRLMQMGTVLQTDCLEGRDYHADDSYNWTPQESVDWVIVGGESGPGHRLMELAWARSIVEQCRSAGVACFVKQLGGWPDKQTEISTFPPSLQVREWPEQRTA